MPFAFFSSDLKSFHKTNLALKIASLCVILLFRCEQLFFVIYVRYMLFYVLTVLDDKISSAQLFQGKTEDSGRSCWGCRCRLLKAWVL